MSTQHLRLVVKTGATTVFDQVARPGRITIGRRAGCTVVVKDDGMPDERWIFAGNESKGWSLVFKADDDTEVNDPGNNTALTANELFTRATGAGDLHFFPLAPEAFGLLKFGHYIMAFSVEEVAAETHAPAAHHSAEATVTA